MRPLTPYNLSLIPTHKKSCLPPQRTSPRTPFSTLIQSLSLSLIIVTVLHLLHPLTLPHPEVLPQCPRHLRVLGEHHHAPFPRTSPQRALRSYLISWANRPPKPRLVHSRSVVNSAELRLSSKVSEYQPRQV